MAWLFDFAKPDIAGFSHSALIADGRSYFLFSWNSPNLYALTINELRFRSKQRVGSAYVAVPNDVEQITLKFKTRWKTVKLVVKLKKLDITQQVDFEPVVRSALLTKARTILFQSKLQTKAVTVKTGNATLIDLNNINHIKNLNYPN